MRTMREAFFDGIVEWMATDEKAIVVLADISAAGLREASHSFPGRILNVGIREQAAIGVAAGLSLEGFHPLVHTYAPFLIERPFEMIKDDLFHQGLVATLVSIGASYDEPGYGRTHQCPEDVALLDTLGPCTTLVPGHADEVAPLLQRAVSLDTVGYLRLSIAMNRRPIRNTTATMTRVVTGENGVVIAVGPMLDAVLDATEGMDVTVLYATTVRPFDAATLREVAGPTPKVVIVEPYLAGTSSPVVEKALSDLPHRILALGVNHPDLHRYGSYEDHDLAQGLDPAGISSAIRTFL
ncbi:transketolase family protein [Ferrimicrobium acidiphilum]|uniref:transketolase family protein n=1 Tax=Ferrimicrobium acidiphilum TaxID=121039 RepID=UPI003C6CC750